MLKTDGFYQKYYYSVPTFIDGTTEFHAMCRRYVPEGARLLEVGSGPPNKTTEYLATLGSVTGVDISSDVATNNALSEWRCVTDGTIPFPSSSFDACVSNYVLEHVEHPKVHFAEIHRVLKKGSVYCFRTPNLWHYAPFTSRLLPHRLHELFANPLRGLSGKTHPPYPTFYRCNTRQRVEHVASMVGFEVLNIALVEKEPSYGRASAVLFFPMLAWERIVNKLDCLASLRANLFAVVRKRE